MKTWKICSVGLLFALATCTHDVEIHSSPPGARVFVNGRLIGTAPCVIQEPRKPFGFGARKYVFRAELDGIPIDEQSLRPTANPKETGACLAGGAGGYVTMAYWNGPIGGFVMILSSGAVLPWTWTLPDRVLLERQPQSNTRKRP